MAKNANAKAWTLSVGELTRRWSDQPFDLTAPSAPTIAVFGSPTINSIGIQVTVPSVDNRTGINSYQVELAQDVNGPYSLNTTVSVVAAAAGFLITGLSEGTQYFVRMRGVDGAISHNISAASNVITQTTGVTAIAAGFWPNWPWMNIGANQGAVSGTLLDPTTHSMIADKDLWMFQSFYPTVSRITSRRDAILAVRALQVAPMNTKFVQYVIPSVSSKVTPASPGQGENEICKELIDDATKGNDKWYIHKTGDLTLSGRVEDFFNPPTTYATNIGHALADTNSLSESFAKAYWKEWDTRWNQGGIDFRTFLAGAFMDNTSMRPLTYTQSNGSVDVTSNVDFNYNGVAENRNLWDGSANAGASQYSAGQFRFKSEFDLKFPTKFLLPNTSGWTSDYTGSVAPPLPLSNHPCYRKWEIVMMEVANNRLGLRRDTTLATGYKYNGGGSAISLFKELQFTDRMLKLDVNVQSFIGRAAVMAQSSMNSRTFTQDDFEFARTMSLICLLEERVAPAVQTPGTVFSLDETLVSLGAPVGTRSMGTLNETSYSFSLRTADQTVGIAKFYWVIFANAIMVWRGENPSVAVWPNPADAAVVCTLPSPGAGKKWQRLRASNYVNPVTGRATRNQSPSINDGADVTTVSLKPFQARLILRVAS